MTASALADSARRYTPAFLRLYDVIVLLFNCHVFWRCPPARVLELYDRHVSARHLEVGPGTGYFLDHGRFAAPRELVLLDASPAAVAHSARRLRRYRPRSIVADVMKPLPLTDQRFTSVGMNFVLHCLPGRLPEKAVAIDHLTPFLDPSATLFGATVLADTPHTALSRWAMSTFNKQGDLSNLDDRLPALEVALRERFQDVRVDVVGAAAVFVASRPLDRSALRA